MCKQALGAFEQTDLGEWYCFRDVMVVGRTGTVRVPKGTVIRRRIVYAGYDDFGRYLESVAIDVPGSVRYQISAGKLD